MERKLLLLIAMLLLFAFNTSAETVPDLPALPMNSSLEVVEQNEGETISFWKKILNFFGFGNEKKEDITEKETVKENKTSEASSSEDIAADIPEFDSSKLQIKRLDEEGSVAKIAGNSLDSEEGHPNDTHNNDNVQENEELTIPKGFEEDGPLKLPEGISELVEPVETEAEKNIQDNNIDQPVDTLKEKSSEQEVENSLDDKNLGTQVDNNQTIEGIDDLKLPDGFDDITIEDSKTTEVPKQNNLEQGLEKTEGDKSLSLEPTNKVDPVPAVDNSLSDNSADVVTKSLMLPKDDVQVVDKPADNLPENVEAENNTISDATLPPPDYATIQDDPQKLETKIDKYTNNLTNKESEQMELPKITEEDYETNEKGEIKKSAEIDPVQLQFVNNETQVLILPEDDVVLGELTKKAKLHEMDLYSYIKLFWANYYKLKREPQREVIERFIEEYDENFNQEKFK